VTTTTPAPITTSPPPVTCLLIGNTCGENNDGVCRVGTCNPGEMETHDTIFCSGDYCSCCVSKLPTTPPAATTTSKLHETCALIGNICGEHSDGLCRNGPCNYDETECYDNSCSGAYCRCCVPRADKCISLGNTCGESNNGVCKATACNYREIKIYDTLCSGSTCNCCVAVIIGTPPPTATTNPTITATIPSTTSTTTPTIGSNNMNITTSTSDITSTTSTPCAKDPEDFLHILKCYIVQGWLSLSLKLEESDNCTDSGTYP
ncbi:unnamed protein product, partial [Meganyctiphanes norvegica]